VTSWTPSPFDPDALATVLWAVPMFSRLIPGQVRFALGSWPVLLVPAVVWPQLPRAVRVLIVLTALVLTVVLLRRLAYGVFTARSRRPGAGRSDGGRRTAKGSVTSRLGDAKR
jgi:hypothetical protein